MMAPVPLIRRNYIVDKLRRTGAYSPETAVTFQEAGVINPTWFPGVVRAMLRRGALCQVGDKFYLPTGR